MVRLGPLEINWRKTRQLAEPNARKMTGEIGHITRAIYRYFADHEYLPELRWPQNLKIYDQMRRSDGQVQAVLYALELPIRSTRWFVRPFSESPRDKEIAEFVEENLMTRLEQTWDDVLRLALTMLPFGHSVFEIVYDVGADGYLYWRKFAERPQTSIANWVADEHGDLEAIEQMAPNGTVTIPASKLLVFTHRKEGGDPRGTSVLRAAYKHWHIKDFLYKIINLGTEYDYVGVPYAEVEGDSIDPELESKLEEILEGLMRGEKPWFWIPAKVKINRWEGRRDQGSVMEYLEHHDLMIARSVLAAFLNLPGSNVGSYALSEDQSDLFLMTLNAMADYIADVINRKAIPQLVRANWNVGPDELPWLDHDPVGGKDPTKLVNAVAQLTNTVIKPDESLEDFMREYLGLPEAQRDPNQPTGGFEAPPENDEDDGGDDGDNPNGGGLGEETEEENEEEPEAGDVALAEGPRWRRPLTPYEQRINLAELDATFDKAEDRLVAEGLEVIADLLEPIWPVVARILRQGDIAQLLTLDVDWEPLAEWLAAFYVELMQQAGEQAAEELDTTPPEIPVDELELVKAAASVLANDLKNKVMDRIRIHAMAGIEAGIDPDDIARQLLDVAREQAQRSLLGQATARVNDAVNRGRNLAAKASGAKLAQYSAILDDRTCPLCEKLDGMIGKLDDPDFRRFKPPLHHGCRCIWAYILPEEEPQPKPDFRKPPKELVEEHGGLVV